MSQLLGYSQNELIHMSLDQLSNIRRQPILTQARMKWDMPNHKIQFLNKNGHKQDVELSVHSFSNDENTYTLLFSNKVIHNDSIEQTLFKTKSLLQLGEKLGKLGAWTLDLASNHLEWSPGTYAIHELSETFTPTLTSAISFYHPEDIKTLEQAIERCKKKGEGWDLTLRIYTANGNLKWTRSVSEPLYENGKIASIFGTFQDISEQKFLEQEKQKLDLIKSSILESTSDMVGESFLKTLASSLRKALDAKCAMFASVDNLDKTATSIAFWLEDELKNNFTYNLKDTPCEDVSLGKLCLYRDQVQQQFPKDTMLKDISAESYVGAPLLSSEGEILGIAIIIDDKPFEDEGLIKSIFSLFSGRAAAELERLSSNDKLINALKKTVQAIALTIEQRDPYTAGHQRRVAILAEAIAKAMGLSAQRIEALKLGASIHDIGKISIASEILNRPGELGYLEYELIKTHSANGYEIVKDIDFPWPLAQMILQHHERLDGTGYPNGLKGEDIILEARIIAVADVVEAMTSHRPYRSAKGLDAALKEIDRGSASIYDPNVVAACHTVLNNEHFKW